MTEEKQVIKNVDMNDDMQQDALIFAKQALEKYNIEKDIAAHIKREFDKKYGTTWHCIVGRNFGSYVTHGKFENTFDLNYSCVHLMMVVIFKTNNNYVC
jgi:dynein light chain LC8-type